MRLDLPLLIGLLSVPYARTAVENFPTRPLRFSRRAQSWNRAGSGGVLLPGRRNISAVRSHALDGMQINAPSGACTDRGRLHWTGLFRAAGDVP